MKAAHTASSIIIELSGHQIHLAHTGPEAVAKATPHRPNVAILDIGMPGLSGYEVAKRIRAEAWGSRLIFIAMTGWGQEDDKGKAKEAGFDHHVTKPVDPSILEQLISSWRLASMRIDERGQQEPMDRWFNIQWKINWRPGSDGLC